MIVEKFGVCVCVNSKLGMEMGQAIGLFGGAFVNNYVGFGVYLCQERDDISFIICDMKKAQKRERRESREHLLSV
jgi:hypothetical protein